MFVVIVHDNRNFANVLSIVDENYRKVFVHIYIRYYFIIVVDASLNFTSRKL